MIAFDLKKQLAWRDSFDRDRVPYSPVGGMV